MKRLLLAICAVVALGVGWAVAQNVQRSLNGLESWQVGLGGPGGSGVFTNTNAMRGGRTYAIIGTTTTYTGIVSPGVDTVIIGGAITTLNLSLPAAPFDQQTVTIACPGGTVGTLTLSVGAAQSASVITGPAMGGTCTSTVATSVSETFTASANNAAAGGGFTWLQVK